MKKILLTAILVANLMAAETQNNQQTIVETTKTIVQQPAELTVTAVEEKKGITTMDVVGIVATPVVLAGAVVAAVVLTPVWIVKKIFE